MEQETSSGSPFKWVVAQLAGGAALGFIASNLFGPTVISWWYKPPSQDAFSCAPTVESALGQFVTMQLVAATLGGIGLTLIVFLIKRALRNRGQHKPSPA